MQPSTFVETIISNPGLVKELLIRMATQTRNLANRIHEFNAMGIRERLLTTLLARSPVSRAKSRSPGRAGRDATRFHQQGIAVDAKGRI
jgi:hypothetical protein